MKKTGFTLAEVLIVIGIIGVVAAITIPTLINAISSKAKKTQTDVIETRLLDGINRYSAMEDGLSQKYETTYDFLIGLSKYYKMSQICKADEITKCIPYSKISYEIGEGADKIINSVDVSTLVENTTMMSKVAAQNYLAPASFITAQGTPVVIAFKKDCIWDNGTAMKDIRDSSCVALMYDKNGVNLPNKMGHDIESIGLSVAVAGLKTINGVKVMEKAFFPSKGLTTAECLAETTPEKQAEYNNLKVDDNTAIESCYREDDRWAAAMKYCKEKGYHLPSINESLKLVQGLFKNVAGEHPTGTQYGGYYGNYVRDAKLAQDIGITSGSIWTGKHYGGNSAIKRGFDDRGTSTIDVSRAVTDVLAICIGD